MAHVTITTKITWAREVSRIVYQRCLSCHREGGSAFSLEHYEQARPWAKAIQEEVLTRRMPPWGAVKGFGEFANDQGLTQEEVNLIAEWVDGGAPEGDLNLMPVKPRQFSEPLKPKGKVVQAPLTLSAPMILQALQTAAATQVTAQLPDGSIEPLLWTMQPMKNPQTYVLAKPLRLPPGTRIVSAEPISAYVTAPQRPNRTTRYLPHSSGQTAPRGGASQASGKSR